MQLFDLNKKRKSIGETLPDELFAVTPESLLAQGDVHNLLRFLHLSDSAPGGRDLAKQKLFEAAESTLATLPDGRGVRLELFAWPVTVAFEYPMRLPMQYTVGNSQDRRISLKLNEMWARALGARKGVLIAPQLTFIHINALLDISPMSVRKALQIGAKLTSGEKCLGYDWGMDDGERISSDADVPATYLMLAYVASGVTEPSPSASQDQALFFEMDRLVTSFFSTRKSDVQKVFVGTPMKVIDAVTQAQGQQICSMIRRAYATNRSVMLSAEVDPFVTNSPCFTLSAAYCEKGDEDPSREIKWVYSALWRPASHLNSVNSQVQSFLKKSAMHTMYTSSAQNDDSEPFPTHLH